MTMQALDLFCGAGGAALGLKNAGFRVYGVDIKPQPRYCAEFCQSDALTEFTPEGIFAHFDFVWASPPCQVHTALKTMGNARPHADLIPQTRELLEAAGVPYVIENVPGAPLRDPFKLRGTMFGLEAAGAQLLRERHFEASFPVTLPPDDYDADKPVIGIYGGHYRNRRRSSGLNREAPDFTAEDGKQAMGIDWMTGNELSQAIPPAYSEYIARQWLALSSDVHQTQEVA